MLTCVWWKAYNVQNLIVRKSFSIFTGLLPSNIFTQKLTPDRCGQGVEVATAQKTPLREKIECTN